MTAKVIDIREMIDLVMPDMKKLQLRLQGVVIARVGYRSCHRWNDSQGHWYQRGGRSGNAKNEEITAQTTRGCQCPGR